MALRDHEPIVIEDFNGLWRRGDRDSVPLDHFADCDNIQFIHSGFKTRDGLNTYRAVADVVRLYTYTMQEGQSLLLLTATGDIYHSIDETTLHGPILSIPAMTDFGFVAYNGRAYITPFHTITIMGLNRQVGLPDEFVYVYKGDGTPARKAAGEPPVNGNLLSFTVFNSQVDGKVDKGIHLFAASIDGSALGPEVFPVVNAPGGKQIEVINLPTRPTAATRTIYATKYINPKDYNPDQTSYTYYEVITITDPTIVNLKLSFSDAELTVAATAGSNPPTIGGLNAKNSTVSGYNDPGFHLFAIVYETDTGFLTAPGPEIFAGLTTVNLKQAIEITNIPVSPDDFVVKRHIVATKVIPNYNGDQKGYQFFFVPEGTVDDNCEVVKTISFYDADLLQDASHLIDNFSEIPALVGLNTYHGRMIGWTSDEDISLVRVSAIGEPEAISQVDGLLIFPLDGNPITNGQEFRDVLYIFKKARTVAYTDNGDVPSSWPMVYIDQGIGASVHGVATVLDSGGINIDYLLITDFSGVMVFNGAYARPELTWKIADLWFELDRNDFNLIQIYDDSLEQLIFITLPEGTMLMGDYKNGLDAKSIRWTPWSFDVKATTITLIENNKLIIGSQEVFTPA